MIYLISNTIKCNKKFSKSKKFRQNPRGHVCCFDCEMALKRFIFNLWRNYTNCQLWSSSEVRNNLHG